MDIASLAKIKPNRSMPDLNPGDTVKVSTKIVEGEKERIQVFQGVVLKTKSGGAGPILTVRRVTYGIGVERTFPLYSPRVEKVEIVRHGKTRRARLFYLRGLSARASRIKEKRQEQADAAAVETTLQVQVEQPPAEETQTPPSP
jgi:large subunit ribosomal protein L19